MENEKVYKKAVLVRMTEEEHRAWRKLAYLNEVSMASLIRGCVEERLKNNKKLLINSDIAI